MVTRIGRYEVLGELGKGGLGTVMHALDPELDRVVAIKLAGGSSKKVSPADASRMLEFEKRVLASVEHDNVVRAYDAGIHEDRAYVVMEKLTGSTLKARLALGEPLPDADFARYAIQIAAGLGAIHKLGAVHADIKPSNIFITDDERVKILDLGIAQLLAGAPIAQSMIDTEMIGAEPREIFGEGVGAGTQGYMAPEQILDPNRVDRRADIFGTGCVFFEMLTGRPFGHCCEMGDAFEVLSGRLRPDLGPVSVAYRALLTRCLAGKREERFASGMELYDALRAIQAMPSRQPVELETLKPRKSAPSGIVTLLFTDVDNSTQMTKALGDDIYRKQLYHPHSDCLLRLVEQHTGHVANDTGDGFLLAFPSPSKAIEFAVAAQEEISRLRLSVNDKNGKIWSLSIGIGGHLSMAGLEPDDRGNYRGNDVNFAARIASLADGGQILLSNDLHRAANQNTYKTEEWRDRRIRSFDQPETVWELLWDGKSRGEPGHRWLPSWYPRWDTLIRRKAQDDLIAFLGKSRVVTVHGAGGMGKTRLAQSAAMDVAGNFQGGVFFTSLSGDSSSRSTLIAALCIAFDAGTNIEEYRDLVRAVPPKPALLIIDNFELAAGADAAGLIRDLLGDCPELNFLVTGQTAVNLHPVERILRLERGMETDEAHQLFVSRAELVGDAWQSTTSARELIEAIVNEVERIPLAIELAAGWTATRSLEQIRDGLRRQPLGVYGDRPPETHIVDVERHRSMRRCIEWSYAGLPNDTQRLIEICSLFEESFGAPSVAFVADVAVEHATSVIEFLFRHAFIYRSADVRGAPRYMMHRFIRAFAAERLAARASALATAERKYVRYYDKNATFGATELQNAIRAVQLADKHRVWRSVSKIARNLEGFLQRSGNWLAWRTLEEACLHAAEAWNDRYALMDTLLRVAKVHRLLGQYDDATLCYVKAIELAENRDPRRLARTRDEFAMLLKIQGQFRAAEDQLLKALETRIHPLAALDEIPKTHERLANLYIEEQQWTSAETHLMKSLSIHASRGTDSVLPRMHLADVYQNTGRFKEAEAAYREVIATANRNKRMQAQSSLAGVLSDLERHGEAHDLLDDCMSQLHDEDYFLRIHCLRKRARVLANEKRFDESVAKYHEGISFARRTQDIYAEAILLDKMGRVEADAERFSQAFADLQKSLEMFQRLGSEENVRKLRRTIAQTHERQRNAEKSH